MSNVHIDNVFCIDALDANGQRIEGMEDESNQPYVFKYKFSEQQCDA